MYVCLADRGKPRAHPYLHPNLIPIPTPHDTSTDAATAVVGGSTSSIPGEVTVEEIHRFIEGVFTRGRFSAECNIIALVYINRVISGTGMPLHQGNWK